ncbi:hypothetical protein BROUX41_003805 [Berkeleyomyces rouxiae]|uniref:uncharacterized protein n=1 Tax=Berkeleyomyces rouxiae TaxID=2035830 RepID=UPI003B7B60B2
MTPLVSAFPFCLPHHPPSALLLQSLSLLAPNLYYRQAPGGAAVADAGNTSPAAGALPAPAGLQSPAGTACELDTAVVVVAVAAAAALFFFVLVLVFVALGRLALLMYDRRSSCRGAALEAAEACPSLASPRASPVPSPRAALRPPLSTVSTISSISSVPALAPADLIVIPPGTRITEFIGEGSANVVVRIQIPESCSPQTKRRFQGKLLRLQKASKHPENRPYPYVTQHAHFRDRIVPLFPNPDDLVSHELVQLDRNNSIIDQVHVLLDLMDQVSTNVQHSRNQHPPTPEMLHESTGIIHPEVLPLEWRERVGHAMIKRRHKQFIGSKLAYVEHGLLVEDMSINDNEDGILVEIKPKWLLQSASAPAASARCRNCAIELRRARQGRLKQTRPKPCPLLLMSDNWRHRREFMAQVLVAVEPDEWYIAPLLRWAGGTPATAAPNRLLALLRDLQARLDQKGPLLATEDSAAFPLAMTMRDCSVFIRVVRTAAAATDAGADEYSVSAKIGDLDMKNASAKLGYWKRTEMELLSDDAYTDEDYQLKHQCGLHFSAPAPGAGSGSGRLDF